MEEHVGSGLLGLATEEGALAAARRRAADMVSVPAPSTGRLLAWLASSADARHVVEVGSAAGVTGLWMLAGMAERGILTSVEPDPRVHALGRRAFDEAGVGDRVRAIAGDPLEVLTRLSDEAYDLCLLQAVPHEYARLGAHALRLLRPGGVLVVRGVLRPAADSREDRAREQLGELLADDGPFACAVLPLDGGMVLASVRRAGGET